MFVLGLDVGTQGVRGVIADADGEVWADCSQSFDAMNVLDDPVFREQRPDDWWNKTRRVITDCIREIEDKGYQSGDIVSLAVDGTSGTILLADGNGETLTNGIMYNDSRSVEQAKTVSAAARDHESAHGYRFNSSYALPKILWLKQNMKELYGRAAYCIHQTDYIVGKLTGNYHTTDYSNALKTGYDLFHERWGDFIPQAGLDIEKLPKVVPPGEKIASISEKAARETGLSKDTLVAAGATDGYASAFSAGAVRPGEWASIIGTTFVLKGVTREFIKDSQGRVYSHKHPEGYYMPGGASNAGGSVLNEVFGKENFARLDKRVLELIPTQLLVYPLSGKGERFPFVNPDAERFVIGTGAESELYTAYMEGVGYVEKMSYAVMESLGCSVGSEIYAVGGATKSGEWLKIRATILNKTLKVPKVTNAAMGSAMIAASKTLFGTITEAVDSMLQIEKTVKPFDDLVPRYENLYEEFAFQCHKAYGV